MRGGNFSDVKGFTRPGSSLRRRQPIFAVESVRHSTCAIIIPFCSLFFVNSWADLRPRIRRPNQGIWGQKSPVPSGVQG